MIIVDTDVFSAIMNNSSAAVVAWLDRQVPDDVHLSVISWFEILSGIEKVQDAGKRRQLHIAANEALDVLGRRIMPFDQHAAAVAADLFGERRRRGLLVGAADTQIAGIVLSQHATFATRNIRHFADLTIPVVNPWTA
jgi:predicted nucleic acid-binding protein